MAQGRAVVTTISHSETRSQWPQQMTGGVNCIVLRALVDEELPGDEQCSSENECEHRGRELTGIIHRADFSVIGTHGERRPTAGSSYMC